jgi:hypothetical protein
MYLYLFNIINLSHAPTILACLIGRYTSSSLSSNAKFFHNAEPSLAHKKSIRKFHVQNCQKMISFLTDSSIHLTSKRILTRVGFEPTPFRTSVLDEP